MKKILSLTIILVAALNFTSCSNEEDLIFDKSAAERLNEASDLYSSRLMASPNGWAMQLYPTNDNEYPYGNGYLLLCRFNKDHSVNVSMDNVFSDNKYMEDTSLWEVITDNGPVLSFNSFNNCLHAFSNPEDLSFTGSSDDPNDETGTGAGGDYEFIIVDAPEDASYMMLKGKKRGTYNLLTPIETGVEYSDYLADVKAFQNKMFSKNVPTFDVMYLGDKIYKITDANDGIPNIYPYEGDAIIDESFNAFLMTKRGNDYYLRFRDAIKIDGDENTVQEFRYDTERDIFESVDNAEYYIDGDDPVRFFKEVTIQNGMSEHGWQFTPSSDMSPSMKELVDAVASEFKSRKNTLLNISIHLVSNKPTLHVQYRTSTGTTANAYYTVDVKETVNGASFTVTESVGQAGQLLTVLPTLNELVMNTLQQEFNISGGYTKFDMNYVTFTAASNPNTWVIMSLK